MGLTLKFRGRNLSAFVFACLLVSASVARSAPVAEEVFNPPRDGKVTAGNLNVRARPGLFYEVVAKLTDGASVRAVAKRGDWLRILVSDEADAWVSAQFVGTDGAMQGDKVRVRAGAGVAFTPYHRLREGETVHPTGEEKDGWVRIRPPEEATVWVSAKYVELVPRPDTKQEPDTQIASTKTGGDDENHADSTDAGTQQEQASRKATSPDGEASAQSARKDGRTGEQEAQTADEDKAPPPIDLRDRVVSAQDRRGNAQTETPSAQEEAAEGGDPETEGGDQSAGEAPEDVTTQSGTNQNAPAPQRNTPGPLPAPKHGTVGWNGVLVSLGQQANDSASHVLLRAQDARIAPVAYLTSRSVSLAQWEGRSVRIFGERVPCDWSKPLIAVKGLMVEPKSPGTVQE